MVESSATGHLAPPLFGARTVPPFVPSTSTGLVTGKTREKKGEKGGMGMVTSSGWKVMPERRKGWTRGRKGGARGKKQTCRLKWE